MITKLPTELVPGDKLASYDILGRRLRPAIVEEADTSISGAIFISTDQGPVRAEADKPVEIEP